MRVLLAALFVFAALLGAVILLSQLPALERMPPALLGIGLGVLLVTLCAAALFLFNRREANALGLRSESEQIAYLEKAGALVATEFHAVRVFEVAEFEDEGMHYFIELADKSVLYLNGQYLYDYDEVSDDPEINQARRFPCSEFTVRRHRSEGYVVDIQCRGAVLTPEIVAPPFSADDYHLGRVPEDGEILTQRSYDEIKVQVAGRR